VGRGNDAALPTVGLAEVESTDAETEAPEVGELNFFAEKSEVDRDSGTLAQAAETPSTRTTLLEDVSQDKASREAVPESTTPPPAAVEQARSEPTPEPVATAATQPGSAAPAGQGEHVIQVFSSTDQQQAKQLIQTLTSGGFPAFLSPVDVRGQTMYRVRIGPYVDPKEAETVAERVRKSYRLDTWVTR
jgi:DedD protein